MRYEETDPGEWIKDPKRKYFKLMCCDCSLVHRVEFKIVKKKIYLRMWRDNKATSNARRKIMICPQIKKPLRSSAPSAVK